MSATGSISADRAVLLSRAREYPYERPAHSIVWRDGELIPFMPRHREGRTPVLAFGSNQSPLRLAQKFGHQADHEIPVERVTLDGFDVVYSAHITRYGAVPAMLQTAPGACVSVAITWLDDRQIEIMHESELSAANYGFGALDGVTVTLSDGAVHDTAFVYVGARGHLGGEGGAPHALQAIPCRNRKAPACSTADMLTLVQRLAGAGMPEVAAAAADDFVVSLVTDHGFRAAVSDILAGHAHPFTRDYRRIA